MYFLYRHFDANKNLLYVGISLSAVYRLSQHKKQSHWFCQIREITIEQFETRDDAIKADKKAISEENPAHNLMRPSVSEVKKSKAEISSDELTGRIVQFNPTYTVDDVARILNLGQKQITELINDGKLGCVEFKKNGTWKGGRNQNAPPMPYKPKKIITGWQLIEFIEAAENGLLSV